MNDRNARADTWMVVALGASIGWLILGLGGAYAAALLPSWVLLAAATSAFVWRVAGDERGTAISWAALLPLPFLVYAFWNAAWVSPAPGLARREVTLLWGAWGVFALVLQARRGPVRVLVGALLTVGVISAGIAFYQFFWAPEWLVLGRTQAEQYEGRAAGSFGSPNSFAGLMVLMLPVVLAGAFDRGLPRGRRWLLAAAAALFAGGLVVSGSRGGWISGVGALLFLALIGPGSLGRKILALAASALVLSAASIYLYSESDFVRSRVDALVAARGEATRPVMWRVAWQLFQDEPIVGTGAASYNVLFDRYRPASFQAEPEWAHNDYLNLLSDYGAVGAFLVFGAAAGALVLRWRGRRSGGGEGRRLDGWIEAGAASGLAGFAAHAAVDFHLHMPALLFVGAVWSALLLRPVPRRGRAGMGRAPVPGLLAGAASAVVFIAVLAATAPPWLAEGQRIRARERLDSMAKAEGLAGAPAPTFEPVFRDMALAVRWDPGSGQAWSDRAYAWEVLSHRDTGQDPVRLGRWAEEAAQRAVDLHPMSWEAWVRHGVALDMQGRWEEAGGSFLRALELAPTRSLPWFYQAYHLSLRPREHERAEAAVRMALRLDPGSRSGKALLAELTAAKGR